ncbi:MAG TPA: hypothetical protein PKE69_13290, partial [Pyrinomonadaceae bacterium]|nr:hypothetical protein [Pyrinomonadaceae bacterium]
MSADGANRRQLTFDPKNDLNPRAAPDGKRILFLSNRTGMPQVWQMDADGGNPRQITNSSVEVRDFEISPDGRTIIYEVWLPAQESVLFQKPIDGSEINQLPFRAPYHWNISPDGKFIAYQTQTPTGMKVRFSPFDENKTLKEFDLGNSDKFVWTKDGKALLFDRFHNDSDEINIQPIDGGASKSLTNFNSDENIWNFDISPSGKRIVLRRVKQYFDIMQIKLN